jgi:putative ABC transport system substrate-binding protein
MNRRPFLGCLLAGTATLRAQVLVAHRVGILDDSPQRLSRMVMRAFMQVLANQGHRVDLLYEYSEGRTERLPELADRLLRSGVEVVVASQTSAAVAAKAAIGSRPVTVVLAGAGDPVAAGLVKSLARPGGNVIGLGSPDLELHATRLELLRALVPRLRRVGMVVDTGHPAGAAEGTGLRAAARAKRLELTLLDVRRADDLERAFDRAATARVGGVVIGEHGVPGADLRRTADLAMAHKLASIHPDRAYADAGGLLSYGVNRLLVYREAALFVGRILGGTQAADLAVEPITQFQLVVNRHAAGLLSIEVPDDMLVRADAIVF